MAQYQMQARSSSSGDMVTWLSLNAPDFEGADFPGPGDPEEIAAKVIGFAGEVTAGGGTDEILVNVSGTVTGGGAYLDASTKLFRFGPNALTNTTVFNATMPSTNEIAYGYRAGGHAWFQIVSGSTAHKAALTAINSGAGATSTTSIGIQAPGSTFVDVSGYQNQAVIESSGASNHCIVFGQALGSTGLSAILTARLYRSGAFCLGNTGVTDNPTSAQGGLTGPVFNITPATGTFVSTNDRATIWNRGGYLNLHGHRGIRIGTHGVSPDTDVSLFGVGWPQAAANVHSLYAVSDDHNIGSFVTNHGSRYVLLQCINTSGGASGIHIRAPGAGAGLTGLDSQGVIEQVGGVDSALVFAKLLGDGTGLAVTGRLYQRGAFVIGDAANNDTATEAQAGLTGPLANISPVASGTLTSVANQVTLHNAAGVAKVQGHAGVDAIVDTTTIARASATGFLLGAALQGLAADSKSFKLKSTPITFASANITMVASQYSSIIWYLAGTTGGARDLIGPDQADTFAIVDNGTADTITLKKPAGTGFAILAGETHLAHHNGTDYVSLGKLA